MTKQEEIKLFYEFIVKKNLLMLVVSNIDINTVFENITIVGFISHTRQLFIRKGILFPNYTKINKAWHKLLSKIQII